jgi:hypothetical protein
MKAFTAAWISVKHLFCNPGTSITILYMCLSHQTAGLKHSVKDSKASVHRRMSRLGSLNALCASLSHQTQKHPHPISGSGTQTRGDGGEPRPGLNIPIVCPVTSHVLNGWLPAGRTCGGELVVQFVDNDLLISMLIFGCPLDSECRARAAGCISSQQLDITV